MKVQTKQLQQALSTLEPALSGSASLDPVAGHICFIGGGVYAHNGQISIFTEGATGDEELNGWVAGKRLMKFVGGLKVEEVDVSQGEGEVLLKAGRSRAGLTTLDVPHDIDENLFDAPDYEWDEFAEQFIEGLRFCRHAVDPNPAEMAHHHLYVGDVMMATDPYRLAIWRDTGGEDLGLMIPYPAINPIIDQECRWTIASEDTTYFYNGQTVISFSTISPDIFPDTAPVLSLDQPTQITLPFKQMHDVLGRIGALADHVEGEGREGHSATVSISKSGIKMRAESGGGWAEEVVRTRGGTGGGPTFNINVENFLQFTEEATEVWVDKSRIKFVGDHYEYVLALVAK